MLQGKPSCNLGVPFRFHQNIGIDGVTLPRAQSHNGAGVQRVAELVKGADPTQKKTTTVVVTFCDYCLVLRSVSSELFEGRSAAIGRRFDRTSAKSADGMLPSRSK